MFILMGFLLTGVKFEPTSLVDLKGKWTVGLRMSSLLIFSGYSVLWRPWKTVMVGIEGSNPSAEKGRRKRKDSGSGSGSGSESGSGSVGIGVHKYFRAHSSFSPFIALSPRFSMNYQYYDGTEWREYSSRTYEASVESGVEYFFTLYSKQMSIKVKTSLVSASQVYTEIKNFYGETYSSDVSNKVSFNLPTSGSLSTWLCFHF